MTNKGNHILESIDDLINSDALNEVSILLDDLENNPHQWHQFKKAMADSDADTEKLIHIINLLIGNLHEITGHNNEPNLATPSCNKDNLRELSDQVHEARSEFQRTQDQEVFVAAVLQILASSSKSG